MRKPRRRSDCPIHFGLEVFGDPWSLLIVRDLMFKGRSTYMEFIRAEEGVATNVLADRLRRLEAQGIITSTRDANTGRATHYRLTQQGIDLMPILLDIIDWSARYDPSTAADPSFVRQLHVDREGLERRLRRGLAETATNDSEATITGEQP